jgi:prepilin-type N-terminal cleavage/methylation domain-containing protein
MAADTKNNDGKQKGFTLIELLIAIMILAVGLSAAAAMQAVALNSNAVANRVSVASFLAQQAAEEISSRNISDPILNTDVSNAAYPFIDWSTGVPVQTTVLTMPGAGTFSATYTIRTNRSPVDGSYLLGMTEITVTVGNSTYTTHKMVI